MNPSMINRKRPKRITIDRQAERSTDTLGAASLGNPESLWALMTIEVKGGGGGDGGGGVAAAAAAAGVPARRGLQRAGEFVVFYPQVPPSSPLGPRCR